jgi:hypothetical protein
MARKTVRVDIPINRPDDLIKLAEDLKQQHDKPEAHSPLDPAEATAMSARATLAKQKRSAAADHQAQAQRLHEEASTLLGTAPGQTSQTPDTLHHDLTGFRDALLVEHRGTEEALSAYGFNVVVGTAASPTRPASGQGGATAQA